MRPTSDPRRSAVVAPTGLLAGICFLPLDTGIRVRVEETRIEELIAEHNPFATG